MTKFTDQIKLAESVTVRVRVHNKDALRSDKKRCAWPGCENPVTTMVNEFPACAEHVTAILEKISE